LVQGSCMEITVSSEHILWLSQLTARCSDGFGNGFGVGKQ
jgi:hypothetical protein